MSPAARKSVQDGAGQQKYPVPLATHEEVVEDPILFWDTLRRFHSIVGTKFMIPVIGGKELDLHVLYVETTARGGYEKVVAEKKWKEVGSVFRFSPTTTSASFVLRKHYSSLLYHYEQVHFFTVHGPRSSSTATFPLSPSRPKLAIVEYFPKLASHTPDLPCEGTGYPSFAAIGTIDGKFDCGYLVSLQLGSEVFRGVVYHPDQPGPSTSTPKHNNALVPLSSNCRNRSSRRRRRSRRAGEPSYPKPNRSGYNFFFSEKHYKLKLKSVYPNREREFTKIIGQSWNNLSAEERMVYQNIGLKDKERYKRELKEYIERMKLRETMEVEKAN